MSAELFEKLIGQALDGENVETVAQVVDAITAALDALDHPNVAYEHALRRSLRDATAYMARHSS